MTVYRNSHNALSLINLCNFIYEHTSMSDSFWGEYWYSDIEVYSDSESNNKLAILNIEVEGYRIEILDKEWYDL